MTTTDPIAPARSRLARLYPPFATLILVLVVGNLWATRYRFNALTAAQNERLRFTQGGDAQRDASTAGITLAEAKMAEQAVTQNRITDGVRPQLMFTGNSQALAIMDHKDGDMITPQWLEILLARKSPDASPLYDVRLCALPNLTETELVIELIGAAEHQPRQVDVLLSGCVLEEFRGISVRDELMNGATPLWPSIDALVKANPDLPEAAQALKSAQPAAGTSVNQMHVPLAARFDDRVNAALDRRLPLFAERAKMQAQISFWYYDLRNRALRITTATARPVPQQPYQASLELLEMTLRYARSKNIHVVLYLAPIRPVKPNPNLPQDVERFRKDMPSLAARCGALCLDYTDLVPEQLWTNYPDDAAGTQGQRDFAHFTGAAHKLLADRLMVDVGPQLQNWAREIKAARQ